MSNRIFYAQIKLDLDNPQDRAVIDLYHDQYATLGIKQEQFAHMKMVPNAPANIALENEVKARQPAIGGLGAGKDRGDEI